MAKEPKTLRGQMRKMATGDGRKKFNLFGDVDPFTGEKKKKKKK